MTPDTLSKLWNSTAALYSRFDLDPHSVPPDKRRRYLNEKVLELMEASVLAWWSAETEVDVSAEAAGVFVTVLGLLQAHGITLADFEAACESVAAKKETP